MNSLSTERRSAPVSRLPSTLRALDPACNGQGSDIADECPAAMKNVPAQPEAPAWTGSKGLRKNRLYAQ